MNCPACGAPNEADAQFCAECGSLLENNEIEATIAGQKWPVDSESVGSAADEPAVASQSDVSSDLPAETETETIDQAASPPAVPESDDQPEELLAVPVEDQPTIPESPEIVEPLAEPLPKETPADVDGAGGRKGRFIMGGVVLLFIIICCCCSVFAGAIIGVLTSESGQEILRDLSAISMGWPLV